MPQEHTTNRTVTSVIEMSPSRGFKEVLRRITWLNRRIEEKSSIGRSVDSEVQEREALIWLMDKVKVQAEKILELKDRIIEIETLNGRLLDRSFPGSVEYRKEQKSRPKVT